MEHRGPLGSEMSLCVTAMRTHVIIHLSKPLECTPPRVKVLMTGETGGGGCEGLRELYFLLNFSVNLKLLKNIVYFSLTSLLEYNCFTVVC